ncbi:hypothetical protein [Streptomyces sp. NBC_00158]|uniref:hypothetical protein n=1 Tax=Streptomyces sp. NBC_00158 TaxID=2903627 RepID=UPI002F91814C
MKIDTVRRVVVGEDDWAHSAINDQAFLARAPDTWGEPPAGAVVASWKKAFVGHHAQGFNLISPA